MAARRSSGALSAMLTYRASRMVLRCMLRRCYSPAGVSCVPTNYVSLSA